MDFFPDDYFTLPHPREGDLVVVLSRDHTVVAQDIEKFGWTLRRTLFPLRPFRTAAGEKFASHGVMVPVVDKITGADSLAKVDYVVRQIADFASSHNDKIVVLFFQNLDYTTEELRDLCARDWEVATENALTAAREFLEYHICSARKFRMHPVRSAIVDLAEHWLATGHTSSPLLRPEQLAFARKRWPCVDAALVDVLLDPNVFTWVRLINCAE